MSERVLYDCDHVEWDDAGPPERVVRCHEAAVVRLDIGILHGSSVPKHDWCAAHARQALESALDRAAAWKRAVAEHAARSTP